jgi:hypothetical protein
LIFINFINCQGKGEVKAIIYLMMHTA